MNCERVCIYIFWLTIISKSWNGTEKFHENYSQTFIRVRIPGNTAL